MNYRNLKSEFICYFSVEVSFFEEILFLPFPASLCESDTYLEEVALGVYLHRYDRCTHLLSLLCQTHDLLVRDEEESFSLGFILGSSIGLVLGYMTSNQDRTTRVDRDV